jgi:hypothetical protein
MIAIAMIGIDENPDDDAIEGIAQVLGKYTRALRLCPTKFAPTGPGVAD